jgi:hypothetical protein
LKCDDGLRFGIFDPETGRAVKNPMPYFGPGGATPYNYMIKVENCRGPVEIRDIELDGNIASLRIGGQYGDTGWQLPATGLALFNNSGPEVVANVYTHHHGQDGLLIDGVDEEWGQGLSRRIVRLRSEYNGRQGCSIVGGLSYRFEECEFSHTGKAGLVSAPGAGVDIEAEGGKRNRDLSFTDCRFSNNIGSGLVADTGDSEGAMFIRCAFVGTTSWSAWPNKPGFRFQECSFAGALARAFGDADPLRATQWFDCTFSDDPGLSPTGELYGGTNPDGPLADLADAQNLLFSRCAFIARHAAVLPWSVGAIYVDCRMEQRSRTLAFPRGTFAGRTVINGNVDLSGSRVVGEIILNAKRIGPVQL